MFLIIFGTFFSKQRIPGSIFDVGYDVRTKVGYPKTLNTFRILKRSEQHRPSN